MAQPSISPRDLVIHTGQSSNLIADLSRQVETNRHLLKHWGIDCRPPESLLPAILRNNWKLWQRQEQRRRWNPWHRKKAVWVSDQSMLSPLLQERRLQRLRPQLEERGFRLVIMVHLLDGEELMARDYARAVMALRWGGTFGDFVAKRLQHHPLRYHVDRLFMPLLERCGALGVRFVLHTSQTARDPEPSFETLLDVLRTGHPVQPLHWLPQHQTSSQASLRQFHLSRLVVQGLGKPPKGARRQQLVGLIKKSIEREQTCTNMINHPWAPLVIEQVELPESIAIAQQRLARKAWGAEWPQKTLHQREQVSLEGLESLAEALLRKAPGLDSRRNFSG
ncbi:MULTISPECIES: hypothetical protein [Aphanothece]|uniref:hypothetical protein n=1 Tax=Aphanothece TaxID=1121 RepID=UPI00398F0092